MNERAWKDREVYANDLGDERALIAVSAASNRSKADQDPSTWLSTAVGYGRQYVTDRAADETRWGLSVDTDDLGRGGAAEAAQGHRKTSRARQPGAGPRRAPARKTAGLVVLDADAVGVSAGRR
ncbi:hypothetical protein GCM10010300_79370 [Streptomyces olivaceoviridis]|uniref:hypothetical protein n=1 Tax=Streptomyces olivaceoviridis TaxID=1921 RepID=UPI00199278C6|nr:hypothetical protein GCM10010300_79370 [Streptomyces olivaceoviridis]